jgi:hypothetical protein
MIWVWRRANLTLRDYWFSKEVGERAGFWDLPVAELLKWNERLERTQVVKR